MLRNVAPSGQVCEYDRHNLPLYAELLDADAAGIGWAEGKTTILRLGMDADADVARQCWESHLERARWIVGDGLEAAITAFGER